MPYINVDEAYILDNTGLQVDQAVDIPYTDAGLSETQQEQARKNIAAGGTNPNLLDNPFFTVNQRSLSTYTGTSGMLTVDRWRLYGASNTVTVSSNGVGVSSGNNGFVQVIPTELADYLNGKVVTLSVLDQSGNIAHGSMTYSKTGLNHTGFIALGSTTVDLYCGLSGGNQLGISVLSGTGNTVNLRAAKLEPGPYSTLANDVPPDYASELAKCMRYFQRIRADVADAYIGSGACFSSTLAYSVVTLPVPLRATPTTSLSGTLRIQTPSAGLLDASSATFYLREKSRLMVSTTVSGATTGYACLLLLKSVGDYIDLSADL